MGSEETTSVWLSGWLTLTLTCTWEEMQQGSHHYNSTQGRIVVPILFIGMEVERTCWDFLIVAGCELQ